jgi:hypothetical protein
MKKNILRLISDGHTLILPASDGSRLICDAKDTFLSGIDDDFIGWGLDVPGIATPETPVQVYEMIRSSNFMNIFKALPGKWSQKWLSQHQFIDFCETLPNWLIQSWYGALILIKDDENKLINENKPADNLVVVHVNMLSNGLSVSLNRLDDGNVWGGKHRVRVVSPKLTPLVE